MEVEEGLASLFQRK